jgi:hypothetical protein
VGFHVLRGPRPQDAGHLRFGYCFDSKVGPVAPLSPCTSVRVPDSQSNLKSPQTLATAKILTHFIISIAVLENVPLSRVTEKSNFSTLNVGLAGTGHRTRATCMAGSVFRRSAIHYASYQKNYTQSKNWPMISSATTLAESSKTLRPPPNC